MKGKKIARTLAILFEFRFKSGENNILRLAIHLFSNRPIYYLLFDWLILFIGMGKGSNDLTILRGVAACVQFLRID